MRTSVRYQDTSKRKYAVCGESRPGYDFLLSDISKEREPDASVLVQIADFYDVSLDYLVGRSEKRER